MNLDGKMQLTLQEAAWMAGESPTTFRQLVDEGYYPKPVENRPRRRKRWSHEALKRRLREITATGAAGSDEIDLDEEFGFA